MVAPVPVVVVVESSNTNTQQNAGNTHTHTHTDTHVGLANTMAKPKVLCEFMAKINNFWVYLNGIQVICS